jgi:hypothetical protein
MEKTSAQLVHDFLETTFVAKVKAAFTSRSKDGSLSQLDGNLCDLRIALPSQGGQLIGVHRAILGFAFPLIHELFFVLGTNAVLRLAFPSDFTWVIDILIHFCYVMAVPSFNLDNFLNDASF